jgi:hypothetical protein
MTREREKGSAYHVRWGTYQKQAIRRKIINSRINQILASCKASEKGDTEGVERKLAKKNYYGGRGEI